MKKRLFAILLTLTMVLTYMPAIAFADGEATDQETPNGVEEVTERTPDTSDQNAIELNDSEGDVQGVENIDGEEGAEVVVPEQGTSTEARAASEEIEELNFVPGDGTVLEAFSGEDSLTDWPVQEGATCSVKYKDGTEAHYTAVLVDAGYELVNDKDSSDVLDIAYTVDMDNDDAKITSDHDYVCVYVPPYTNAYSELKVTVLERPKDIGSIKFTPKEDHKAAVGSGAEEVYDEVPSEGDTLEIAFTDGTKKSYTAEKYIDEDNDEVCDFMDLDDIYGYSIEFADKEQTAIKKGQNEMNFVLEDYFHCDDESDKPATFTSTFNVTGVDEEETCDHQFSEWEPETEPTCTEAGEDTRVCSLCGKTESKEVAALGHDFGDWEPETEPTCTEAGEDTRTCSRCDAKESREVAALGHDFGEWTEKTAPTCTDAGEETRECSRCDAEESKEVAALGHDFGEWHETLAPTFTDKGKEERECSRCDAVEEKEIPALENQVNSAKEDAENAKADAEDAAKAAETAAKTAAEAAKKAQDAANAAPSDSSVAAANAANADAQKAARDAEAAAKTAEEKADAAQKAAKTAQDIADKLEDEEQKAAAQEAANDAKTAADAAGKAADSAKDQADAAAKSAEAAKKAADKAQADKAAADQAAAEAAKMAASKTPVISTTAKQGKRRMYVNWNKVDGAAKYVVAYRKAGKGWTTKTTTKTSYTVKGMKKKGLYEFKVASIGQNGEQSEWSAVDYRYFFGKNPSLRRGKGSVRVKWAKDKKATGYQVFYSTHKNMSDAKIVTLNGKGKTSYKITGLKKGQRVYVRIRPLKNGYIGVLTNKKSAKAR